MISRLFDSNGIERTHLSEEEEHEPMTTNCRPMNEIRCKYVFLILRLYKNMKKLYENIFELFKISKLNEIMF